MDDSFFTITVGETGGKTTIVTAISKMKEGDIKKIAFAVVNAIDNVYNSLDREADFIMLGDVAAPKKKRKPRRVSE